MNHIVTGCIDCCFCNQFLIDFDNVRYDSVCTHPFAPKDNNTWSLHMEIDNLEQPITPDNCPLKKENLTIVFDNKD